jgi:hypothetical protein
MGFGRSINRYKRTRRWVAAILCLVLIAVGQNSVAARQPIQSQEHAILANVGAAAADPCGPDDTKATHLCCTSAGCAYIAVIGEDFGPIMLPTVVVMWRKQGPLANLSLAPPFHPPKHFVPA